MPYDEKLADRVRAQLKGKRGIVEVKMFGGLCFMDRGNMAVGVEKNNLVVRVGKERYPEALKMAHARVFDLTGRPLGGFVYVAPAGVKTAPGLKKWLGLGFGYTAGLPGK